MPSVLFKEKFIEFLMEDILDVLLVIKYTSFVLPFVIYRYFKLNEKRIIPLFVFLFLTFILSLFEIYAAESIGTAVPVYHISVFVRYLTILLVFYQILKHKVILISLSCIAMIIFGYESIYLNGWLKNNEILTVFSHISITVYAGYCLYKVLIQGQIILENYSINLIGLFLVYSGSSTILSFFETEIAQYQSFADFFLIIYYNIVETFLNLGIAFSIWKLKEA